MDSLVKGKHRPKLEFMQWFKALYEENKEEEKSEGYDPLTQRAKGNGGAAYTDHPPSEKKPKRRRREKKQEQQDDATRTIKRLNEELDRVQKEATHLRQERDFYFNKLQNIENILKNVNPTIEDIRDAL